MKFGQLIECNKKIFFFKSLAENEAGRLVPELFLFIKTALYKVTYNKSKLYKTVDVLNFDFFRKGPGNSFSATCCV